MEFSFSDLLNVASYDVKHSKIRLKYAKYLYLFTFSPFLQPNGYKPAPLDLHAIELTPKMEELVELLAENTHNVYAKERIQQGWTFASTEVCIT